MFFFFCRKYSNQSQENGDIQSLQIPRVELINVFKGDMSIVGPRPHMLAHTETYARLIDKYMVRHFIKPGVTGWAQTHGFRGETKELSQMEGRVKADIWYMEHWTILLDLYIIYKTVANVIVGEKNAY